ncbi:MAG: beta-propeller domain-containing protein [Candidatus Aenigmarchaeota archaeon]|nr:beta-propeller domain-containing protein [Candidatus Aenigmarchaeota archaeon]
MKGQTAFMILGLVLVSIILAAAFLQNPAQSQEGIKRFNSYSEMQNFLKQSSSSSSVYDLSIAPMAAGSRVSEEMNMGISDSGKAETVSQTSSDAISYSETNIQVEGVDEADIIKTDGDYIYVVSGGKVTIIDAYPAEQMTNVSEIKVNGSVSEILINDNRLILFGWEYYYSSGLPEIGIASRSSQVSFVKVYDITDKANPVLKRNVETEGNYYDSRMIGDYVYVIVNQPIYYGGSDPIQLPSISSGSSTKRLAASDVYYFDHYDTSYTFTTVLAINSKIDNEDFASKTFLLGYTQNMHVSQNNIYVTYTQRLREADYYDRIIDQAIIPNVPFEVQLKINGIRNSDKEDYEKMNDIGEVVQDYIATLDPEAGAEFMKRVEEDVQNVYQEISKELEKSIIHKISISGGVIDYVTSGEVPGYTLDQFSMDEHNGYFRVATTTNNWRTDSLNHMYVLDENLNIVGKVEDLASGETIHSVRFMGDKAYMVTFRQIDPLFVLDLSNPTNPEVLGYLKITGVSEYLHPYDETHIIGVGRDATEQGRTLGMKVSLFDVSDVSNPTEISKYIIGESGTYSEALYEHKAILFDREKNLLVLPVRVYENNYEDTFQGAYVLNVDLTDGITLRGTVTHTNQTVKEDEKWYYDWNSEIRRSLYIDNVLYTASNKMIKANNLYTLDEISEIELSYQDYYYGYDRGMIVEDVAVSIEIDE